MSACSSTCGYGEQSRTRTCQCPPKLGSGNDCFGSPTEDISCDSGPCCGGDCGNFECDYTFQDGAMLTYTVNCAGNCQNVRAAARSQTGDAVDLEITTTTGTVLCSNDAISTCGECAIDGG